MKKSTILWVILALIFLVFFNVIFFLSGGIEHELNVWISYGFIHLAYIMLLLTSKMVRLGKSTYVFGMSLFSISATYFTVATVVGIVFISVTIESIFAVLLTHLCITGIFGIIFIAHMIANDHTAEAENERLHQIEYVKEASGKLKQLLVRVTDKEAKKKLESVYDVIDSSPVKSHPSLAHLENRTLQLISEIEYAVSLENKEQIISLANTVLSDANERNMQIKALN